MSTNTGLAGAAEIFSEVGSQFAFRVFSIISIIATHDTIWPNDHLSA